jgi:serine/threonine protein kinase
LKCVSPLDVANVNKLNYEFQTLWNLQSRSGGQSNSYIVQCLHQGLAGSGNPSDSAVVPIFLTDPLKLFPKLSNPISALVLESGGPNLTQFLQSKSATLDVTHRVHILRDIVSALDFLHMHEIVHGDFKPENIVAFASLREGWIRWKLVDLESCHDMRSHPFITSSDNFSFTPEYSAPELIAMCRHTDLLSSSSSSSSSSPPPPPPPLQVTYSLDIWSLGMVSVYLFKGYTTWQILYPQKISSSSSSSSNFILSRLQEWNHENSLNSLLTYFTEKEKGFISDCLKLRSNCQTLLKKSLFSTNNSTIHANTFRTMSDHLSIKFDNLMKLISELLNESNEFVIDGMEDRLSELFALLTATSTANINHVERNEVK